MARKFFPGTSPLDRHFRFAGVPVLTSTKLTELVDRTLATEEPVARLAAFAGGRVVGNLLYGLKGSDPVTLIGASLLLLGVATAAAYWPARRASLIDPLVALRYE
jgi:ABC-type antimicrobial peptide transport system permease subunit